jgi:hypothetical protein
MAAPGYQARDRIVRSPREDDGAVLKTPSLAAECESGDEGRKTPRLA